MNRDKFRKIVDTHLVPLFSGATLEADFGQPNSRRSAVRWHDIQAIEIKPDNDSDYCVTLRRNQPFAKTSSPFITEYKVIQSFTKVLGEISDALGQPYEEDILATFSRRVVAKSLCNDPTDGTTLLSAIDHLDGLATRLYEGQPITAALGFENGAQNGGLPLSQIWDQDYFTVLTNGLDTILVVNMIGNAMRYECLAVPAQPANAAPHRLAPIANWTVAQNGRIAMILNRMGEILAVKDGRLVFARRSGHWHFLTHEPVVTQMKCPQDSSVREAVYASCIDASFARTGACIGVMSSGELHKLDEIAPKTDDHVINQTSPKAAFLRTVIANQKFQDIDRRLRLELLSIDGATILSYTGEILAVGAILQIPGGSSGGGRLAAAVALSKYGAGIKVSQDGQILGFHRCSNPRTAKPSFIVM